MNLDYNDEQIMLREQIQKFCESEYDFYKREDIVKSDDDFDSWDDEEKDDSKYWFTRNKIDKII